MPTNLNLILAAIGIAIAVILVIVIIATSYVKAPPNKAYIITGLKRRPKILIGKAGLKLPFLERRDELLIEQLSIDIKTGDFVPTADFIGVNIDAVAKVQIRTDDEGIKLAMKNFLNMNSQQINAQLVDSLQGNMREIIGTIDRLADMIDSSDEKSITIQSLGKDKYRLLPQQKAIYAACKKNPGTLTYNMPVRIALSSDIDREKIKSCLTKIVEHHCSLKTYIKAETDNVYGIYDANVKIYFEEYSDNNITDFVRPFDLSKAPLIRFAFTETSLLFDMHHIIGDGETINIILRDLANLYGGGKLTDVPVQYSDYSEYFYSQDHYAHKVFFKEMLKCDFEPVVLPEKKHITESRGTSKFYNIKNSVFDAAKKFAHRNGLTDTMLFLGAWGILLSKYTAKNDILSSIIMSNRIHSEIKDTAGMFVNTLPVFMNVTGSVSDYFNSVKNTVLGIYEYQELPFFDIAEFAGMKDKSVINTSFVYQADGTKMLDVNGESFAPELIETHTAKFDLSFELTPSDNGCTLRIEYNTDKYDDSLIERLYKGYIGILEQLSSEMLADISVLDEDEYNKVIFDFNDTAADYQKDKCVHELFAEQVQRTPDKISLIFEDKKFTYKQLDEMSNSLAHYLREEIGIKSNDVVPVIAKRSWHIIVAMLGILKSGGAYLLIDYQYPNDRIDHLVSECKSDVIITFGYRYESIKKIIKLDKFDFNKSNYGTRNINKSNDIFCSIHTSGSTGVPKLSILTHRNINHYIKYASAFFENVNQTIASTTIAFDAFVQETIVSLCNNTTVILLNEYEIANVLEFEKQIDCYYYSFNFQ
nr:AMP-binding protein [Saccharofermentans sp.]